MNLSEKQFEEVYKNAEKCGLVLSHETTQAFEDATFQVNQAKLNMKGLAVSIGAEMLPMFQRLTSGLKDTSEWFNGLSTEEKQAVAQALEFVAAASAVSIALQAGAALFGPYISWVMKLVEAYRALELASKAAMVSMAAAAAVAAAAVAYGAYDKYQHHKAGGTFDYDPDTGQVYKSGYNPMRSDEENARLREMDEARKRMKAHEEAEKVKKELEKIGQTTAPITSSAGEMSYSGGGGKAGSGGKSAAKDMTAEINRLNESLTQARAQAADLQTRFDDWKLQVKFEGLDGADRVYGELDRREQERMKTADDYLKRYTDARIHANELVESAKKTGDAGALAEAQRVLAEQTAAEVAAAQDVAAQKLEIARQTEETRNSIATQAQALQAELQKARNEGELSSYMQVLSDQNVAFMAHMEEQQALQDQYYQWRMEAEQTYSMFALEAMRTIQDGLSSGIADAIVNGGRLSDVFKDVTKQVVQMFIQWQIRRALAHAFGAAMAAKEAAKTAVEGKLALASWAPAATAKLIVNPGAGPAAIGIFGSTMASAASFSAFATGGLVSGPGTGTSDSIPAMLSHGEYVLNAQAVRRIGVPTLNALNIGAMHLASGGPVDGNDFRTPIQGGNKTINIQAMDPGSFIDFLRTAGGNALKQFLLDDSREFATEAGTW